MSNDSTEFELTRRQEVVLYFVAIATYIPLGVFVRTAILNWIAGPVYVVLVVWAGAAFLARRARRQRNQKRG